MSCGTPLTLKGREGREWKRATSSNCPCLHCADVKALLIIVHSILGCCVCSQACRISPPAAPFRPGSQ